MVGKDGLMMRDNITNVRLCQAAIRDHAIVYSDRALDELPCQVCGRVEDDADGEAPMIICDQCESGWHLTCLDPVLESVPEGAWICPECTGKRKRRRPPLRERRPPSG